MIVVFGSTLLTAGFALMLAGLFNDSNRLIEFSGQSEAPNTSIVEANENRYIHYDRNDDLPIKNPKRPYNHLTDRDPHRQHEPWVINLVSSRPSKPAIQQTTGEFVLPPFFAQDHEPRPGSIRWHGRIVGEMPENATKSGSCQVQPWVNKKGEVVRLSRLKCSDSIFEEETRMAAMKWRYNPLIENNEPVEFEADELKISYRLLDEDGNIIPE